jgi:GT2 family glycosyltransferase
MFQNAAPDMAIVITTYKRDELLQKLFESIAALNVGPSAVYVVDNAASEQTEALARKFNVTKYIAMTENTGGAGGFSRGIEEAYLAGHEWIWVMDDDVCVLEGAIEALSNWTQKTEADFSAGKKLSETVGVYQGFRKNFDNTFFYWQYNFLNHLGIPNPVAPSKFEANEHSRPMNTACFEGSLFHRKVIEALGLPDARFFIYWDDTMYGYLASKVTNMLLVDDFILQRTRPLKNVKIGSVRKLNSTSNMSRYHIMRNRGHMAHYLALNGDYNPIIFWFGTVLTFAKEVIRLFVSHEVKSGFSCLTRGMHDAKVIRKDKTWQPYSKVHPLR